MVEDILPLRCLSDSRSSRHLRLKELLPVAFFELLDEIAAGGMSTVYRGRRADGAYEQDVAVKLFAAAHMDASVRARFDAERRILAALEHPGIARVIDGGTAEDGTPYLVMEWVDGEPVTRWCRRNRVDLAGRLELFRKLCEALETAHRRGIVHRDIKAGNVLVTRGGEPKLIDFGIARVLAGRGPDAAEGVELIQHIAAVFRSAGHDDQYYHDVNDGGVANVIEAAREHHVPRTVHCSTVGVHGHVSTIPSDETAPFNPGDIYQVTKLAGEQRFQKAMDEGMPGVIFRPAGMYGPGDLRFLKVFRGVQKGRFPMFGSGEVTYQFTYIDDMVEGIILCGEHEDALGGTYIICGDGWITLNRFVELVAAATGGRPPKVHWPVGPLLAAARACELMCKPLKIDPPLHVRRCEFYIKARAFSNAKIKRELGFQPRIRMPEGVYRTARWYHEQGLIGPIVDRATYEAKVQQSPARDAA